MQGQCDLPSTVRLDSQSRGHRASVCVSVSQTDLNPVGLGEVYVLNDGGEVDLDLGNYERYLNVTLSRDNNITTGKIYRQVIEKEVGLLNSTTQLYSCVFEI